MPFEPFTVTDGYSRFILACEAFPCLTGAAVILVLTRFFQIHGLPRVLRTDNGSPFASRRGLAGLSRLLVWLLTLEGWPDRIAAGRPDQNGRHESMHRVLREDAASLPAATMAAQQTALDVWREDYNTLRPHEAVGERCPASLYLPSPRAWPARIAACEYPADHHVRRVNKDGYIKRRDDGGSGIRFRGFDLAVLSDALNAILVTGLSRVGCSHPGLSGETQGGAKARSLGR